MTLLKSQAQAKSHEAMIRVGTKGDGNCGWASLGHQFLQTFILDASKVYVRAERYPRTYQIFMASIYDAQNILSGKVGAKGALQRHTPTDINVKEALCHLHIYYHGSNYQDISEELSLAMRLFHYRAHEYTHEHETSQHPHQSVFSKEESLARLSSTIMQEKKTSMLNESLQIIYSAREALQISLKTLQANPSNPKLLDMLKSDIQALHSALYSDIQPIKTEVIEKNPSLYAQRILKKSLELLTSSIQDPQVKENFQLAEHIQHFGGDVDACLMQCAARDHALSIQNKAFWTSDRELDSVTHSLGFRACIQYNTKNYLERKTLFDIENPMEKASYDFRLLSDSKVTWSFFFTPGIEEHNASKRLFGGKKSHQALGIESHWEPVTEKSKWIKLNATFPDCPQSPEETILTLPKQLASALEWLKHTWRKLLQITLLFLENGLIPIYRQMKSKWTTEKPVHFPGYTSSSVHSASFKEAPEQHSPNSDTHTSLVQSLDLDAQRRNGEATGDVREDELTSTARDLSSVLKSL